MAFSVHRATRIVQVQYSSRYIGTMDLRVYLPYAVLFLACQLSLMSAFNDSATADSGLAELLKINNY